MRMQIAGFEPGGRRDADGLPEWVDVTLRVEGEGDHGSTLLPSDLRIRILRAHAVDQARTGGPGWERWFSFTSSAMTEFSGVFDILHEQVQKLSLPIAAGLEIDAVGPSAVHEGVS